MTQVRLHYWAGARAAAGVEEDLFNASTIADALAQAGGSRTDQRFAKILSGCSLLLDGRALHPADLDQPLAEDVAVEVLPPFAGG
jgi:molybdopterin converting factor small subunit